MPNAEKIEAVLDLKERLQRATAVVLCEFRGLTVADVTAFRGGLRQEGLEFHVVKNTLLGLAAKDVGIQDLAPHLHGPTAILLGFDDVVAPARALMAFAKDHKEVAPKAGILEGRVISDDKIRALAALPSRDVLLGQVAAGMAAPMNQMVSLLQAPLRNLAYGLQALLRDREAA